MLISLSEETERGKHRRIYPRFPYEQELTFRVSTEHKVLENKSGFSHNVSQGGIAFTTHEVPPMSSVVMVETDFEMLSRCVVIDDALVTVGRALMGKVVRIQKKKDDDSYDVSLSFITEEDSEREDVTVALAAMGNMKS
ncbi:MAG: hypothetical protein KKH94_05590 [Candidatus Omnitrophica bacterium]|nr:hypothetical protein [Candidatus Omnitrophota bacterium]